MSSIHKSLVIASKNAYELSKFYAFVLDGEVCAYQKEENHCVVNSDGIKVHIYQPSKKQPWPKRGRASALCLEHPPSLNPLIVVNEWASSLIARGALRAEEPILKSFGAESWMTDPEGNYFLIFVPCIP